VHRAELLLSHLIMMAIVSRSQAGKTRGNAQNQNYFSHGEPWVEV
jgi:hypothetical protein